MPLVEAASPVNIYKYVSLIVATDNHVRLTGFLTLAAPRTGTAPDDVLSDGVASIGPSHAPAADGADVTLAHSDIIVYIQAYTDKYVSRAAGSLRARSTLFPSKGCGLWRRAVRRWWRPSCSTPE